MNWLNSTSATSWTFFNLLESIARALGQTARLDEALQAIDSIDSLTGCEKVKRYQTPKRSSNIRLSAFFNSATKTATHAKKTNHLGLICTKQNNENPCSRRRSDYGNYACVISAHCSMSDFSTSFIPPRNIPQFSDLHGHFGIPCPDHEAASRYASRSRRTLGQVELGNDPWFGPSVILCGCPGKRDLRYGEINNVVVSTICRKENCDIGIVCIMYICIILQFMPLYV